MVECRMSVIRKKTENLNELGGTVGGPIAVTWNPDFSTCL